ncbi:hypothetical protein D2E51_05020 [Mycobacteroides abscessus]|nr:hypothetical protein DDT53_06530 [Mycobacteroides abscessus]QCO26137.1 hypothetical protein CFE69_09470 [Mycobacteroides abscessus subsp. massiliense]TKV36140.1 hypothetical protein CFA71_02065 [Mycobacteroides abscessus subsp. bolletii]AWG58793.1 hypothetical protein DDT47_06900 [Mycobacteroides abscessus]AWG70260.1 hypothetical protein DDT49_17070 [Mycobacteroides abscessus]
MAATHRFTCVAGYSISLKYGEREASAENRWESRNGFTLGAKGTASPGSRAAPVNGSGGAAWTWSWIRSAGCARA